MAEHSLELIKGTLDVLVLKTLSWGPLHGYGVSRALRRATDDAFQVEEGALYPALRRLEKRGRHGDGSGREVLPPHAGGRAGAGGGGAELGAVRRGDVERPLRDGAVAVSGRDHPNGPDRRDPPGGRRSSGRPGRRSLHGDRPNVGELPLDEDVRREIESHIEMRVEELVAEGWDPAAAEEEAMRAFGDRKRVEGEMRRETRSRDRAVRRARGWESVLYDVRYALRGLARSPGFAAMALGTLALGIGANTAIFSVVNGVLLRPLPYADANDLVFAREWQAQRPGGMDVAWANFEDWQREATSFDALTAYTRFQTTLLGGEQPVSVSGAGVSAEFWSVFPAVPIQGRLTGLDDHRLGAPPVVVVRENLWRDELGGLPLDRLDLRIAGMDVRVVGVVARDFDYPDGAEIWYPTELNEWGDSRSAHNLDVVGRLAEGVSVERADEELDAITERVIALAGVGEDPDYLAEGALVVPLRDSIVGDSRSVLLLLFGAAALVVLAACTNLASTLLARGSARRRELAIRGSLGAAQGRLVRQLMTESFLLSALGAAVGLALAAVLLPMIRSAGAASVPRIDEVVLDGAALAFTAVVAVATALVFGLVPALRMSREEPHEGLREGDRGSAVALRGGIWRLLVGTEVALALILVVASGLTVRSLRNVLTEDPGFDASDIATAPVALDRVRYTAPAAHARWFETTLDELRASPGVASAGLMSAPPLASVPNGLVQLDGDMEETGDALYVLAGPGTFEALDVPLLRGRSFDDRDLEGAPHVAIVSRSFVEAYWPDEDPLGRSVTGGGMDNLYADTVFSEVVGVVEDVRFGDLTPPVYPTIYFPYSQRPFRLVYGGATLLAESATDEADAVASTLRDVVQRNDRTVPIRLSTLEARVVSSTAERRFLVGVLGGFGLLALLLAAVGIYGVVAWSVARRRREMGIRLALGAAPGRVRTLVLRDAMGMVAGGLVVGAVGAWLSLRVLESQLYAIEPQDPMTFGAGLLVLVAAALSASWIPAHRTTRIDPALTMKAE